LRYRALIFQRTLFFAAISLLPALLTAQTQPASEFSSEGVGQASLKFAQIYSAIQQNYMGPIDPDHAIFDGGVRGMLSTLDPFSAFFDREQFELLKQQTRGEALGFGSILYLTPGKVLILQTAQGSPSWRAGLGPGDEIVEINGQRVNRLDFRSLVQLLQRSRSRPVQLGVIHPGKVVPQNFDLRPAEVALPTLDKAFVWSVGLGYIHLTGFELKTPKEVVDALTKLNAPNLKGLLLDLRDNHGGIVDAAVAVASLFLKPGELVLTTYRTAVVPERYEMPLVVLVNGNTASAAEVLTAALQEHDRAVVAGEPTYGKGVVESVSELSEKTGLALTTGQYFTPSGRSIQRPLPGTALIFTTAEIANRPNEQTSTGNPGTAADPNRKDAAQFRTDDGRPVSPGGGITPDITVSSWTTDPWLSFLNQRGVIANFAVQYLTLHGKIKEDYQTPPDVLDDFKDFMTRGGILVPDEYWSKDQDYLKLRIKVELTNLVFGLTRGDEVETRGDPQVQKASELFPRIPEILKSH
jgi:carboxyl-terminal processing protease